MRFKRYVNILLVIGISAVILFLWVNGLNQVYAEILSFITNIFLALSKHTSISVDNRSGEIWFVVETLIKGKQGTFPQKATLIILPMVMMLTWQILLFINMSWRKALRSAAENLSVFVIFQVIYLLIMTGYYNSGTDRFFFHLLVDSFYIIVLFLIVKDAIRYRLIAVPEREKGRKGRA